MEPPVPQSPDTTQPDISLTSNLSFESHSFENIHEPHVSTIAHQPKLIFDAREASHSWHVRTAWRVMKSGQYNRWGLRIPLPTTWNLELLESLLVDYEDKEVVEWLRFGWPIDRALDAPDPVLDVRNHRGAILHEEAVDAYLKKEIGLGATYGPFITLPYNSRVGISPLNTTSRKHSDRRRVILDLSWPVSGGSVNEAIPSGCYLDKPLKLKYPTVDTLAYRIAEIAELAMIYGYDMHRAYRQLNIDPFDYSLLGMYWKGLFFFDCNSPMGLRSAAIFCQRTTNCIKYIHNSRGFWLMAYQDDLNGAEPNSRVQEAFASLGTLLTQLRIDLSHDKTIEPTTCAEVLGVWFDTVLKIMAVTPERIKDTMTLLEVWRFRKFATKRQLQSLIGKLQFMAKCVRPGRVFISRLLNQLRTLHSRFFEISMELKLDLKWWYEFLPRFNGTSILRTIDTAVPGVELSSDCNLRACGGVWKNEYFHTLFPEEVLLVTSHISQLELFTVILTLKLWGQHIAGKKIHFHCDNQAAVQCVNSGKTKDRFMQQCLREVAYLAAIGNYEVRMSYISTVDNKIPDALSRWYDSSEYRREFRRLTAGTRMVQRRLTRIHFQWSCSW